MILAAVGWAGSMLGAAASLSLALVALRAARRPREARLGPLRAAVRCMALGAALSFLALETGLVLNDFEMAYVAENSSRGTPLFFRITAGWSALAGSIVLWTVVLTGFVVAVTRGLRGPTDRLGTGALVVMGLVSAFFFGMVTTVANPFEILAQPPADGPGPNALLQNHALVAFHPPLLYVGYVGFTVPFAFAMSALAQREAGVEWLRRTRRANLVAWTFLSAGLGIGALWSYEVLGWGGFWAWDPVENAALLPWLAGTAFIHSAVVQVKRGLLQSWNVVLVILTFELTILGTFLTRSSVVASVHSFTQSAVGPALLAFLVATTVAALALFAVRVPSIASAGRLESLASREGAFLVNNLLLSLLAFVTLLGTLYPVFVEAATGQQLSVGRPFFDRMAAPLGLALLVVMGVGPFMPYRAADGRVLWDRLRIPLLAGSAAAAGVVAAGVRSPQVAAIALLGTVIAVASAGQLRRSASGLRPAPVLRVVRGQRGYWGGQLAHFGLVLIALGIAVSADLADRTSVTLRPGESTSLGGFGLTYTGQQTVQRPYREEKVALVEVRRSGDLVHVARPRLNQYPSQRQGVASPDVWSTPRGDLYVALNALEPGSVSLNVIRYPLMWVLWAGGAVVVAGGAWALGGRRARRGGDGPGPGMSPDMLARRAEAKAHA